MQVMKSNFTSVLILVATVTIVGMLTIGIQQIYAPRNCGGCVSDFKKLTNEFEKDVIDAASTQPPDPDRIQTLLGEYSDNVMELFHNPSNSTIP